MTHDEQSPHVLLRIQKVNRAYEEVLTWAQADELHLEEVARAGHTPESYAQAVARAVDAGMQRRAS